ncbi:MAG: replication restart DNA helicase PriA [Elainellaceae cyanobacterium]
MRTIQKTVQAVRCPNCGQPAERHHLLKDSLVRTQCRGCDYLMVTCSRTGRVIEAYAPGISALHL